MTASHPSFRLITANIRKGDADDGDHAWVHRGAGCCAYLAGRQPDCLGLQECRQHQLADLRRALPELAWYGLPRTPSDGHPINAIGWRQDRFDLMHAGGWWLSTTPHQPGSSSWAAASIRLVNWVLLHDRRSGQNLRIINTHLDHISAASRQHGCAMVADEAAAWPDDLPQFFIADANATAADGCFERLRTTGWQDGWIDQPIDTFHGFRGPAWPEPSGHIDQVWHRGPVQIQASRCLDQADSDTGLWPSDHYFIEADATLTAAP